MDGIVKIDLTNDEDTVCCRICGAEQVIPFNLINKAAQTEDSKQKRVRDFGM